MAVRGLGCPVAMLLTGGQRGDAPQAAALLDGQAADVVLADTAYDADALRRRIEAMGAKAVIPNPSRTLKHPFDRALYRERHFVECCFGRLKRYKRVAMRSEKTARNYLAVVTIAATMLWLK